MFKKIFLFLFALLTALNCYSDDGIITVEKRCQIAKQNLELLNNPNKQVYIREDGKLRALFYREILDKRRDNQEIIYKFCSQRVEEKTTDSEKYQTRTVAIGEPSTITTLRNAIIAEKKEEIITALELANIDLRLAQKILEYIEKDDFKGALSELDSEEKNNKGGKNNANTVTAGSWGVGNVSGNSVSSHNGNSNKENFKDYRQDLSKGDKIDLSRFSQRISQSGKDAYYKDPKTGWRIERDYGKGNSHGDSYWKLYNKTGKNGTRVGTLTKDGIFLRK